MSSAKKGIQNQDISKIQGDNMINYALSVIHGRSLPSFYDGLKPVHRRILWAMHTSGNRQSSPYVKSAKIVGDVLGSYHSHGVE